MTEMGALCRLAGLGPSADRLLWGAQERIATGCFHRSPLGRVTAWDFLAICYHPDDMCSHAYLVTAHLDDNPVIMTRGIYGRSASGATSMTGPSICGADDWPFS